MTVAKSIQQQLERSSWIRKMFEEGIRLKAERGAENIFDFTLGNPSEDPPKECLQAFRRLAREKCAGIAWLYAECGLSRGAAKDRGAAAPGHRSGSLRAIRSL